MNIPQDLQPGDWLGYHHKDLLSWPLSEAIYLRTGGRATHSAVYRGHGVVVTSLVGGVNYYDYDPTGLVIVRRPQKMFIQESANAEFDANMRGLGYGYLDCLKDLFPDAVSKLDTMNCSHASAQYYVYGGAFFFASDFPLNTVTPRDFELVPDELLKTVWTNE